MSFSNEDPKGYKFQYPSATLCFQDVVPYYKAIQKFPEYAENVEHIHTEMAKRNDSNFWTNSDSKRYINITGVNLEGKYIFVVCFAFLKYELLF